MTFTTQKPTVSGWYLYQKETALEPFCVECCIYDGVMWARGEQPVSQMGGLWSSRLVPEDGTASLRARVSSLEAKVKRLTNVLHLIASGIGEDKDGNHCWWMGESHAIAVRDALSEFETKVKDQP